MRAVGVRPELWSKIEVGSRGKRFVSGFLANGAQRMLLGMQIVALRPEPFVFNRFWERNVALRPEPFVFNPWVAFGFWGLPLVGSPPVPGPPGQSGSGFRVLLF